MKQNRKTYENSVISCTKRNLSFDATVLSNAAIMRLTICNVRLQLLLYPSKEAIHLIHSITSRKQPGKDKSCVFSFFGRHEKRSFPNCENSSCYRGVINGIRGPGGGRSSAIECGQVERHCKQKTEPQEADRADLP